MHNKSLHMVTFILLIVGGLNWLAIGLLGWGIGMVTDGVSPVLTKVIYILVGLSAVYEIVIHKQNCKMCVSSAPTGGV